MTTEQRFYEIRRGLLYGLFCGAITLILRSSSSQPQPPHTPNPETTSSSINPYTKRFQSLLEQGADQPIEVENLKSWEPIKPHNLEIRGIQFETPVIKDLPHNTVCIYLPGAEEIRALQSMGGTLDYFYQFLRAKGKTEDEAKFKISRLKTNIRLADEIKDPIKRLASQLHIMKSEGIYIIPWEFFPEKDRLPEKMALAVDELIQIFDKDKPVVLIGFSLGGLSLRVFLKMYQSGMVNPSGQIKGGIFISEGYYGDALSYTLYAFRKQLFQFIANDDGSTGKLALRWLNITHQNIKSGRLTIEQFIENMFGNDISIPVADEMINAIRGVIETFNDDPKSLGRILRLTVSSLVRPELITGLSGNVLRDIGCEIAGVRSLQDPHSFFAQTAGIHELLVRNENGLIYVNGNIPPNGMIPQLPESGFDLKMHQKYPEVARFIIGV